jgi:integrase
MPRLVRDAKLETRTARAKLPVRTKPVYRSIDAGLHLGYRKNQSGGKWILRRYAGNEQYKVSVIATADDHQDANGRDILSFSQAQEKCRKLAGGEDEPSGPLTVRQVAEEYLDWATTHGKSPVDTRNRFKNDILPFLGDTEVNKLTRADLERWLQDLAARPRHGRGKVNGPVRDLPPSGPADEHQRRRRSTANRTLTALRACLNRAYRDGRGITSDLAWRQVRPFREVDAVRLRYLDADEIRRLINATSGNFRQLAVGAISTGARFGELTRVTVADFNAASGTLFVQRSKSGKSRHVALTQEARTFFEEITAGRDGTDFIFTRPSGLPWARGDQLQLMRAACEAARLKEINFHALRHSYASLLVMAGVPMMVVARNLGHSDTKMTEVHYAHLAQNHIAESIRRLAPEIGFGADSNVTRLRR